MNIIIVDDEISSLQTFLTEIIDIKDIEYKFFYDNKDNIISYVKDNKIKSAFLDINMPNINGIDLACELIKIDPNFKIVFVTGLNTTKNDLPSEIVNNVLGFIYKPYDYNDIKYYLNLINNNTIILEAKMFNSFDCFINNDVINFSSAKSKELFALLLVYNGKILQMNDAISQLWPDKDIEKSKKLYRDAVWRLRKTLEEYNFSCITFHRGALILDKKNIKCDYWDYLQSKIDNYNGLFCKSYDWALDYSTELDEIKEIRKQNKSSFK